jgi:hypothetical protein
LHDPKLAERCDPTRFSTFMSLCLGTQSIRRRRKGGLGPRHKTRQGVKTSVEFLASTAHPIERRLGDNGPPDDCLLSNNGGGGIELSSGPSRTPNIEVVNAKHPAWRRIYA